MRRDLDALTAGTFDVLVVGAGIHGAWAAWDAASRGLGVALVDRGDFGGGASANSLRVVHGGLRYLQTADFGRMRESIRERSILLRLAPKLVKPLPFVIATRGMGKDGSAALGAALWLTDCVGFDRNDGLASNRRIPGGRLVGRKELAQLAPELPLDGVDGGALWYDGQALDSERLTLACVRSAAGAGAVVANHVCVDALARAGGRVTGVRVRDVLTGRTLEIAARVTLDATGCGAGAPDIAPSPSQVALAMNLVTSRRLGGPVAFGVRSVPVRPDPGGRGARYLFAVPWRDSTLIGTFYRFADRAEVVSRPTRDDLHEMLDECRRALPRFDLGEADVRLVHRGALPLDVADPSRLADRPIIDPAAGPTGRYLRVTGVKFTTARAVAERAVDQVLEMLDTTAKCRTHEARLDHGSPVPAEATVAPGAAISTARVRHAIRDEMALRLGDVVLRRTVMGVEGCPPRKQLDAVADLMATELGWDAARRAAEIDAVRAVYAPCASDAGAASIAAGERRAAGD